MISDMQLREAVLEELDFEPAVDAAHIGVAAHAGVVTLSGLVAAMPRSWRPSATGQGRQGSRRGDRGPAPFGQENRR